MLLSSRGRCLDLSTPKIMGILNITPDSFFDGGKYVTVDKAIRHAEKMVAQGADIIDVGGESSRPGASAVSLQQEIERVIPIVEILAQQLDVLISIDTYKPEVMQAAADAGVHLINDIYALRMPGALTVASNTGLPVCLMHMQGNPDSMQQSPHYEAPVIQEISNFFSQRITCCEQAGFSRDRLLLDPGFGFGKTLEQNYLILANLAKLNSFNLPLLVGMSRKSMITSLLKISTSEALIGSVTACVIAMLRGGACIIRVHDVLESAQAVRIVNNVINYIQ